MTPIKLAFLVFVGLQGCALTFDFDGFNNTPDSLIAGGNTCQDCTKIFELLADLFSNADLQKKIMDGIENVCDHLPGPKTTATLCKQEVEKMLPLAISFLTGVVKPAEVCKILGLCSSCGNQRMLTYFANEALRSNAAAATSENGWPTTQCTFCIFLIKTLEDLLPKERTEGAVIKLLEEICQILPSSYRSQCEDVVGKFSKSVMDAILSYATPKAVCALVHLCKGEEASAPVDPCSSTAYRCKDMTTALKCGTLYYCQKFTWKSLKYNVL